MTIIENYEIAFSRDIGTEGAPEVVLLVLEKSDMPATYFTPQTVRLVEDPDFDFPKLFVDSLVSNDGQTSHLQENFLECVCVPVDILEALDIFTNIWVCIVDNAEVVDEFYIPFHHEDRFALVD